MIDNEVLERIIDSVKVLDLKKRQLFPDGDVYIVGAANKKYECFHLWNVSYTIHNETHNTFGGYLDEKHDMFWTLNTNHNLNNDYAFIVNSYEDGEILAEFLNECSETVYCNDGYGDFLRFRIQMRNNLDKINDLAKKNQRVAMYGALLEHKILKL